MNKKLRLRISRVISTFKTCRPKDSAAAAPPVFHVDFPTPPPPPRPSPSRRMAAAAVVAAAGCRYFAPAEPAPARRAAGVDAGEDDMSRARETPAYLWRKDEKWHVVNVTKEECAIERRRKIDCDDDQEEEDEDDDLFPSNIRQMAASRRRNRETEIRRRRRNQKSFSRRNSTSSVASGSWFSSDDDQENDERSEEFNYDNEYDEGDDTDTLISSRSFSTDSSVAGNRPRTSGAAAMLSRLMPCGANNNQAKVVKESFAVVKRSEDPRGDFRQSMAEMVVEKGIYDATDLEQLLNCFLSLNSRQHHQAIVSAFADIWDAIFPAET